MDFYILPDVPIQGDGDIPLSIFFIFEFWIYLPTLLIVNNITSRSRGNGNSSTPTLQHLSLTHSLASSLPISSAHPLSYLGSGSYGTNHSLSGPYYSDEDRDGDGDGDGDAFDELWMQVPSRQASVMFPSNRITRDKASRR
jgi:hypothetical protein